MYNILHIPSTLGVITKCWKDAETELSKVIEEKYHDLDEEFITKLFYCELNFMLKEARRNKQIEHAFLVDRKKVGRS